MLNFLTVDLEEWFNFRGLEEINPISKWDQLESRVENNANKMLKILNEHNARATFFILGWIAEKYPEIIDKIKKEGHEIGTHGYSHKEVYKQMPDEFEDELEKSIKILKKITKEKILSHRASNFSIIKSSLWAIAILKKHGVKYDSSIYPIKRKVYGIPDSRRFPYEIGKGIIELPLSTVRVFRKNFPVAGGGYFRIMPYFLTRKAITGLNKKGEKAMFYIHPWELDPEQPRVNLPLRKKFNHYLNLGDTERKFKKILKEFKFDSIKNMAEKGEIL